LRALELDGLETNRELLQAVLDDGAFRRGDIDIHYLEARTDLRDAQVPDEVRWRHAAAVGFSLLEERAARSLVPVPAAGWRNVGRALHADELRDAAGTIEVRVAAPDEPAEVRIDGEWQAAGSAITRGGVVDHVATDGLRRRYRVRLAPHAAFVNGPEGQSTFALRAEDDAAERGGVAGECRAPLPGAVTKVLVGVGDVVAEGDGLVVLEAMKMEHTLRALGAGTVRAVHGAPGQQVDVGDLLVEMEPS
jgi:acetyl/propionyl-CoA carboxylase alpha subunit